MSEENPPQARLTLRVGVTGHRMERLQKAGFDETLLRQNIKDVLQRIQVLVSAIQEQNKGLYSPDTPLLRVVSPLAEGVDRIVADEALKLDYELHCPLPFDQTQYEEDFTQADSKAEFGRLLSAATSIFALDGERTEDKKDLAYEAVGRVVLRQSDIILTVWDGKGARGQGGTGQIVGEAWGKKIPILWMTLEKPHSAAFLEDIPDDGVATRKSLDAPIPHRRPQKIEPGFLSTFRNIFSASQEPESIPTTIPYLDTKLKEILVLSDEEQINALHRFLREDQPLFRIAVFYRVFCKLFIPKWKLPKLEIEDFNSDQKEAWLKSWKKLSTNLGVGEHVEQRFRKPFVWSDVIADICADRYRSSLVMNFILGALAVLAAFLGSHPRDLPTLIPPIISDSHGWFWVELLIIAGILSLIIANRLGRWHERWMDYRLLAEGLRQMRALSPFARVTPAFDVPAHLSEDVSFATWYNWYFRALVRSAGLVNARVDAAYLKTCRSVLVSELLSQSQYHKRTEARFELLHKGLHRSSIALFVCTLLACIAHIAIDEHFLAKHPYFNGSLILGAIVLPAFSAAIQGILHQAEFGRIARRSRAIRKRLRELLLEIRRAGFTTSFRQLGRNTEAFSRIQILEQADWRSVFIIKEISLP